MSDRQADFADTGAVWDRDAVAETVRSAGYDVEPPRPGDPAGDSITARRDLGERVILFFIDRAGRFRFEITWLVGEWPSRQELSGIPVRAVDSVSRAVNVSGQIAHTEQVADLFSALGEVVSWASGDGGQGNAEAPTSEH